MKNSVRLSEKHGVNPSMGLCFWCSRPDGTIVLMGRQPNDEQAPRETCVGYEPCARCQRGFDAGIVFVCSRSTEVWPGQTQFFGRYPDGRFVVMTEQGTNTLVKPGPKRDEILKARRCMMDPEGFDLLMERLKIAQDSERLPE